MNSCVGIGNEYFNSECEMSDCNSIHQDSHDHASLIESAWTGQVGIQISQCVQDASLIDIMGGSRINTSMGHAAIQAAQPKHLSSSRTRLCPGTLAMKIAG